MDTQSTSTGRSNRVAFYLRGASKEAQLESCASYAMLFFGVARGDCLVFADEGSLGDEELPGLSEVRGLVQAGELNAVVCAWLGVVCRGTAELLEVGRFFEEYQVALVFVKERLNLSGGVGRVLLYTAETMLTLERETAAGNIRENMRALAREGRWLGGVTPTGYTSRRIKAGEKVYSLETEPKQARVVELIFSLFLESDSLSKVTAELHARKVSTKNARTFSRFTVRQILSNPVYMKADRDAYAYFVKHGAELCSPPEAFDGRRGMMVYNKTVQQPGETTGQRDISEWIVAVGEHEGLIPGADWVKAGQQLFRNKSKTLRKPKSEHGLLAEMLVCGSCGAHMRPKLTGVYNDGSANFFYLCERKEQSRSGECDMPNLSGIAGDAAIDSMLATLGPDEPELLPEPASPLSEESIFAHQAEMDKLREHIAENEEKVSGLVFSLIKAIDKSAYDEIIKQIDILHGQIADLNDKLGGIQSLVLSHPLDENQHDALVELLENWEIGSRAEQGIVQRRAALRVLIKSVIWDGKELLAKFVGGAEFAVVPY